jgi:hypothetical protein
MVFNVGVLPLPDERDRSERTEGAVFFVAPSEEGYMDEPPSWSAFRAAALSRCAAVNGFFCDFRVDTADMYRLEQPLILGSSPCTLSRPAAKLRALAGSATTIPTVVT